MFGCLVGKELPYGPAIELKCIAVVTDSSLIPGCRCTWPRHLAKSDQRQIELDDCRDLYV
jgi:hypothetical protein